jgi:hypothetical protein
MALGGPSQRAPATFEQIVGANIIIIIIII